MTHNAPTDHRPQTPRSAHHPGEVRRGLLSLLGDDLVTTAEPEAPEAPPSGRSAVTRAETRFAGLSAVRLAMASVTLLAVVVDPGITGAGRGRVAVTALVWLVLTGLVEVARRAEIGVGLIGRSAYLVDGIMLTIATIAAGGSGSPLFFLAFVHVIAVTLLGSYITGLKVALWDSLLLLTAAAAETAGVIPFLSSGLPGQAAAAIIRAVALLAVSSVTAACSALNERELKLSREGLQFLLRSRGEFERAHDGSQVAAKLLEQVTGDLGFPHAALVAHVGAGAPVIARQTAGRALQLEASALRTADVQIPAAPALRRSGREIPSPALRRLLEDHENVAVVPFAAGDVRGVLGVVAPRGTEGLPARTLDTLMSLAGQAGQTLQRIQLNAAIEEMAASDGLTGIPNRRRFDVAFRRLLEDARAVGEPLSLLFVDLDNFKLVNDVHGHQVGDEVLRRVATALDDSRRADDLVARYGGEEFAVLLPATRGVDARKVAHRMRLRIAEIETPLPVTVSVGVSTYPTDGHSIRALSEAADRALYAAKAAGRDRVRAAQPTQPAPPVGGRRTADRRR